MRKSLAYPLVLLSIFVVLAATTNPTMAASYTTVGAKPGDSLLYNSRYQGALTVNKTIITVMNVDGTKVTFNVTRYNNDNTYSSMLLNPPLDVSTGGFVTMTFIIASGLTTNDPTYPSAPYIINDTSTMTIAGASRTVSHLKMSVFNPAASYLEIWWDKDTGLMVKMTLWYASTWRNLTLISTTAWLPSAPAQSAFSTASIIAIAGVGIIALVIGYVVGKSGKRRK